MRRGFTLVELLIVIVIAAILTSMVFGLMYAADRARISDSEIRVHGIGCAVSAQLAKKGFPPATLEELAAALDRSGWMANGKFVDCWENPIEYSVSGREFKVWSRGLDGVSGTADDLPYKRN
jgi:prepilin-type N-terminal cleavage/methylation domain-containing protein